MAPRMSQDHSQATYWRKRTEADGEIEWCAPPLEIHNLIRALTHPYVGAHTFCEGNLIVVWQSYLISEGISRTCSPESKPGQIVARTEDGLLVQTGDGVLGLTDWKTAGDRTLGVGQKLGRTLA